MSILDTAGKIAGAFSAVEAAEKVDPNAGLLTEAAAAVGGFEGANALEGLIERKGDTAAQPENQSADNDGATT
ncbi:hypothetical protein AB3X91_18950 [Paraburkholderia sp. BR14263]|uniref:hypothetical protein n=1 Tax=unclassified Paraburkholderia TaxID=2615204 RepID=UPI0034CFFBE1